MNGLLAIILTFFLTTTCGMVYYSRLSHDQQQSVQSWISENTPGTPSMSGTSSTPPQAPEIDETSGTAAIALLAGVLLLAAENSRSRRS